MTKIAIIQGHPDPDDQRFCRALAKVYSSGAQLAGHEVRLIDVAAMDFPFLRTKQDFEHGQAPKAILSAQEAIRWAEHLVFIYPLWMGSMPAYLKAFLEQAFRPGFIAGEENSLKPWKKRLGGRSARIIVTMGMPAFAYRWFYLAHSLKSLERNILGFCGIGPIKETLIGTVEAMTDDKRQQWLKTIEQLGKEAR